MDKEYINVVVYCNEFMDIFNVDKNGAKYRYSKMKKEFNLSRTQYITIYHLRDSMTVTLQDVIDMMRRIRNKNKSIDKFN